MRWFAWSLSTVLATLAACSSFTSTDSPPATVDAGAPNDATTTTDASEPADGGPFSWPITVDDFERPDLPTGGPLDLALSPDHEKWDQNTCDGSRSVKACSSQTVRFSADANPSPVNGTFLLDGTLDGKKRKLRFDFGLSVPNNPNMQAQFASLQLTNLHYIFLEVVDGHYRIGDQFPKNDGTGNYDNNASELGPLDGSWGYYQLYVDLDAKQATLLREGAMIGQLTIRDVTAAENFQAARFGLTYTDGTQPIQEIFDNVGIGQY